MALLECRFFSESLKMSSSMNVILPQKTTGAQFGMDSIADTAECPCLYLLHGLSDDHTIWCRRTSIERYAAPLGIAVIMPEVHRSFYTDMAFGYKYWTFISEELPLLVRKFFRVSDRREDTFVAGQSMGGYGAFKLALNFPERFAGAASLSGSLDMARVVCDPRDTIVNDVPLIFGNTNIKGTDHDLLACAERLAKSPGPKPALYQWCGTEDFLYQDNKVFLKHARDSGLSITYEEDPGGHQWELWDKVIQRVLTWIPLPS